MGNSMKKGLKKIFINNDRLEKPWAIGPFRIEDTGKIGICWAIVMIIGISSFKFAKDDVVASRKVQMKERRRNRERLLKARDAKLQEDSKKLQEDSS